tara:strand:+ start:165 stop:395 length:231 start_codon:yes stop_codon:yes gene_type:complete
MIQNPTSLLILYTDDGSIIRTTLCKETFVSAKKLSQNNMEIVLRQLDFPHQDKFENFCYQFQIEPSNETLKQCLNW